MSATKNRSPVSPPRPVVAVNGPLSHEALGITDAHSHIWIDRVAAAEPGSPVLDQYESISEELQSYRQAGGHALLDCQPGGFGRDSRRLQALSEASGVLVVASTGFHRRRYAPGLDWLWNGASPTLVEHFVRELTEGTDESHGSPTPVRAGFIKIALESDWEKSPQNCIEAAAEAARETNALMEIHTEKGALAERACTHFLAAGLVPHQLVLCHMDKRPDIGLHRALADAGVGLEYDTFHRPKYDPAGNLWPLLERMVGEGYADRVALATDMAEAEHYRSIGGGPGLASLPGAIANELERRGISQPDREMLLGGNIARRLAGLN